jgi:hypothetical protein
MNEFDLISKFLLKHGTRVIDVCYYSESFSQAAGAERFPGVANGEILGSCYFFGNVTIYLYVDGVIVLANENRWAFSLLTVLPRYADTNHVQDLSIGSGLYLLGNGVYTGKHRIYNVGFNRINITPAGIGAATFVFQTQINGYMFRLAQVF